MQLTELNFDTEQMLAGLRPWVEYESPSWNAAAVDGMMALVARDLAAMGARIDHIPGRLGFGSCLRATLGPQDKAPAVLAIGHFDTVHPIGVLEKLPWRRDGNRVYGPGVFDMKAGNYMLLEALRQLAKAGIATPAPVTILFTSDEEVGSPSTRDLIESEARKHRYVLVPEPMRADGGIISGRYAIARFNLEATGRPSHAGATLAQGRSAIREMAKQILRIEEMTTEDCTFSVGVVHGGQWVNCVSTTCVGEALSMAKRQHDLDAGVERMLSLSATGQDVTFKVSRGVTRPVWEPDAGTLALFDFARKIARSIGFDITHGSVGGGSDANFTGALGIPTLDGLGVGGDGAHTLQEYADVTTLAPRARLIAGLLAQLGAGDLN